MAWGTQFISGILTQICLMPKATGLNQQLEEKKKKYREHQELSLVYREL